MPNSEIGVVQIDRHLADGHAMNNHRIMWRPFLDRPRHPHRPARTVIAIAVSSLMVAAGMLSLPGRAWADTTSTVTIATTVNGVVGGSATPGATTSVSFAVTNDASSPDLHAFAITVPLGATDVTATGVTGWTQHVVTCTTDQECSAKLQMSGGSLAAGETVTVGLSFTAPTSPGTLTFGFSGGTDFDGDGDDPFTASGGNPTIQVVAAVPMSLSITSVADTSQNPPLPSPAANQPFAVSFTVNDQFGNVATTPVLVTLTAVNPASGASLTSTAVTSSNGTGVITATYSQAQSGLQLQVGSPGLTPGTATVDVVTAGVSGTGSPGTLSVANTTATLSAGSVGPEFLTVEPCSTTDSTCPAGSEASLQGVFTQANGTELYSDAKPATMTWACSDQVCPTPWLKGVTWPWFLPYTNIDRIIDFSRYPIYVSLEVNGVDTPFARAPSCEDLYNWRDFGRTGVIESAAAKAAGFCVDVYAMSRAGEGGRQSATGALTTPVLFVQDPKLRGN
ncbi:hypothetical protein [Leekyejoonella antrihumi]|uniref:Uncharacterized protein n=1 Tax=Leekyejoonella antrihumi TaxID=1660198 RepID=A0A563E4H1_9MICO|nr:hypothetical protein [Leekyejoonella antrihumi]TWP37428.1 hypothetical protein FGL98_06690 [Leekyejoonella antrihumi]